MIIEFAVAVALTLPNTSPVVTQVEFREPVLGVVTYPTEGELNRVSGLQLPGDTLVAFEEEFLTDHIFFGAFAITKEFGYGYVTGANSIEAAREIAIEECLQQGTGCLIYAEIYPVGFDALPDGAISLASEASAYYNDPPTEWGNYRAMAISEDGAYSIVWNYETPARAAAAALADCEGYTISDLPNLREMPCMLVPFK